MQRQCEFVLYYSPHISLLSLFVYGTGDSRAQVVATSLRIITRLKKDWITTGRRPDGKYYVLLLYFLWYKCFTKHVVFDSSQFLLEILKRRLFLAQVFVPWQC